MAERFVLTIIKGQEDYCCSYCIHWQVSTVGNGSLIDLILSVLQFAVVALSQLHIATFEVVRVGEFAESILGLVPSQHLLQHQHHSRILLQLVYHLACLLS